MRCCSTHSMLVILVLTACLFFSGSLPGTKILCYGADGHIAIENPSEKSCLNSGKSEFSSLIVDSVLPIGGNDSCVDFSASIKASNLLSSVTSVARHLFAKVAILVMLFSHADILNLHSLIFPASFAFPLLSNSCDMLRTIILLI